MRLPAQIKPAIMMMYPKRYSARFDISSSVSSAVAGGKGTDVSLFTEPEARDEPRACALLYRKGNAKNQFTPNVLCNKEI